jgi:hypothetical protein
MCFNTVLKCSQFLQVLFLIIPFARTVCVVEVVPDTSVLLSSDSVVSSLL